MQPFLHDGEIVFQQVEHLRFHAFPFLQSCQNKACDLDALPVPTCAAGNDGNVEHGVTLPEFGNFANAAAWRTGAVWWGEAADEPALARQNEEATAREDARPTEGG